MSRLFLILGLLAFHGQSGVLFAQEQEPQVLTGVLNAMSMGISPKISAIEVSLQDDSQENKTLKAEIENELARLGYVIAKGAPLILGFTPGSSFDASLEGRPGVVSLDVSAGPYQTDVYDARVKLYSTGEDSVFKRRPDEGPQNTAGSFNLEIRLVDAKNGRQVWQGWAKAPAYSSDWYTMTRPMIGPLLGILGKNVKNQPFDLPKSQ